MKLGFIAGIVAMTLREIDYFNCPGHTAGAQHIDDAKVLKVSRKSQFAEDACVATSSDFGLKSNRSQNTRNIVQLKPCFQVDKSINQASICFKRLSFEHSIEMLDEDKAFRIFKWITF